MALRLAGLADALRAAGLVVHEHPDWQVRGQSDAGFAPVAVMWHHDASAPGPSPNVVGYMANLANNGAQCWVDLVGAWHLVAAGRMWHAGLGGPWGPISLNDGNTDSVGVETDHTTGEPWPPAQLDGLRRGTAVLLRYLGAHASALCGHKEYRPTNPDPHGLDMAHERRVVAELLAGNTLEEDELRDDERRALFGVEMVLAPGGIIRTMIEGLVAALGKTELLLDGKHIGTVVAESVAKMDAILAGLSLLAARLDDVQSGEITPAELRDAVAELLKGAELHLDQAAKEQA